MKRVAIIGSGLIGRAWAIVFARAGYEAALFDATQGMVDRALKAVDVSLRDLEAAGLIPSAARVRERMTPCARLPDAMAGASYAQESVPEDRAIKEAVFLEMDGAAGPDAILASSCSAMPGSTFLEKVPGRHRCLIGHPANPPYLMPLVELVPTPWTSPETVSAYRSLMVEVGQVPVVLNREIPGFVMNRLQTGVVNEAMHLVAMGVMSPEDVDKTMRYSIGLRWSFMGPFETGDLNAPDGFQDYAERYQGSYERMGAELGVAERWSAEAVQRIEAARRAIVPQEALAERQAWRDRRLMALLAHIASSDEKFGK